MTSPKTIFQTPAGWRLETVTLRRPDGQLEEKGIVRHPGAVAIVPLTSGGEVLMLHQYRLALDETIVEIPAGTRGWDEAWDSCAQRELQEESGYRAGRLIDLGEIWPAPGVSDERIRLYAALELVQDPLPRDFDEEIEVIAYPLTDLVDMALDGRLRDAKSVAGVLRTARFIEQEI